MRNAAQIVKPAGVRAVKKAPPSTAREGKTTWRRRAVCTRTICLNRCTDQGAGRSSSGGAERCPANSARGGCANDRASRGAITGARPRRSVTRAES